MGERGPPPWEPTEDDLAKIKLYASVGLTQEQIAALVGKSVDTLTRRESVVEAMAVGKAEVIAKVAGKLVQKALAGDSASMFFYLKTQGRWSETHRQEIDHTSSDGSMTPRLIDPSLTAKEAAERYRDELG